MKARCFFGMIPCPFLFVVYLAHTSAASIPSTIDIISDPVLSNLTSTNRQAQSDTSVGNGGIWSWYCTKIQRWSLPELDPEDCLGVLDYFYFETMEDGGRKLKEFRAPGSKKTTYTETEWTPRKYTFGKCTLAIVMIQDFPDPASLPGGYKSGPPSDSSTYHNLWTIAENLVAQCVKRRGEMGWQPTGLQDGIGVFVWSTGSQEDLAIAADEPRFSFPSFVAPNNDSIASA